MRSHLQAQVEPAKIVVNKFLFEAENLIAMEYRCRAMAQHQICLLKYSRP
jgi:hypothetical protein